MGTEQGRGRGIAGTAVITSLTPKVTFQAGTSGQLVEVRTSKKGEKQLNSPQAEM